MARVSRALTFSNVVAFIALFVALGGSVYAAGKINGREIKVNSIPGNRVKPKTLTAKQVRSGSLTGTQVRAGSLTGKQIKAGALTGTQINEGTLTGVTASQLAAVQYASATVSFSGSSASGEATCPAGTNVIGGGATVSSDPGAFVNDSGPSSGRNAWAATGFGEPGTSMTVTAICTSVAAVSG